MSEINENTASNVSNVSAANNESIEKMEKLLEMHIPEYVKSLEKIANIKKRMKDLRYIFKRNDMLIDYELYKRRFVILSLDETKFIDSIRSYKVEKYEKEIREYIELKKSLIKIQACLPFSEDSFKIYNSLTEFEKSYLMYLIGLKNALWNFLYDSKNMQKIIEKSKEYESLKSSIYKIVLSQLNCNY